MQFFPPVQPGPVQTAQFGSMNESLDTKAGQGFEDLLSAHLDQGDAGSDSSSARPPEARVEAVPAVSVSPAEPGPRAVRQEDVRADERGANSREQDQQEQIQADEANSSQSAKPAASEKERVHDDEDVLTAGDREESVMDESAAIADEAEKVLSELAGEVQSLLAGLVGKTEGEASERGAILSAATEVKSTEVQSEGHAQMRGKLDALASRIQAIQDLLRQFRQSEPETRAALSASLGSQLRSLRDDMAAYDRPRNLETSVSKQAPSVPSWNNSNILKRVEAVARRVETSGSTLQHIQAASATASSGEPRKDQSRVLSSESASIPEVTAQTKTARHEGAAVKAPSGATQAKTAPTPAQRAGDGGSQEVRARQDSAPAAPSSQAQTHAQQSRPVTVQSAPPTVANTQKVQADSLAEAAASGAKPSMSAVSGNVPGTETIQAVAAKSAAKDVSAPVGKRESGMENTAGTNATLPTSEPSETKASGGRKEPRPDFFTAPDRDKTAESKTANGKTASKIVLEAESAPQSATSNLQAPTQSRLDAPVNARSSEVYKQVENGAFKNLGQGLKQLVIRLDPADLGQVSVILQVRGKEVQAVLRASSQEASHALNEQLGQLRTQLESQGLKVSRLEVQTQLSDSQSQSEWQGAEQHNRFQENRELALSALRWRTLGQVDSSLARDMQNIPQREKNSSSGLDIFA
jgi:flagellar hook-length control protein FliK